MYLIIYHDYEFTTSKIKYIVSLCTESNLSSSSKDNRKVNKRGGRGRGRPPKYQFQHEDLMPLNSGSTMYTNPLTANSTGDKFHVNLVSKSSH